MGAKMAHASTPRQQKPAAKALGAAELVIITGMSGSGKASVLKAFEDLGYYCVDNLPAELMLHFAELVKQSREIERAALVVDIREGERLRGLPATLEKIRRAVPTAILFLEAGDDALLRRFSETRRPHPLSEKSRSVKAAIAAERKLLAPIRKIADMAVDTSKFNVHELRQFITGKFLKAEGQRLLVSCVSFGYRNGLPPDADLVFDVRFLPNPHFVPKYRPFPGNNPKVARYIQSFPQTRQFIKRISELLVYLLPHYIREGKSYLTIGFGCTGGRHRSVFIAEQVSRALAAAGYQTKVQHRDLMLEAVKTK